MRGGEVGQVRPAVQLRAEQDAAAVLGDLECSARITERAVRADRLADESDPSAEAVFLVGVRCFAGGDRRQQPYGVVQQTARGLGLAES
ncbi:hypothetical protein FXN61_44185, partial [Lentzea sp. PSKA42]